MASGAESGWSAGGDLKWTDAMGAVPKRRTTIRRGPSCSGSTVYGDGRQARCFGHVRDATEALLRLMRTPEAAGRVFNVGSEEEIRILDLAELVRKRAGSDSPIELVPYEEAYAEGFEDMMRRVPDVSRLEEVVGYRFRISLEEIVDDIIEDQKRVLGLR